MHEPHVIQSRALMTAFALETGLTGERPPRRYLWTDAHAVCNYLSLGRALADRAFVDLAAALVEQVHQVLGRHRADDVRSGWISGLAEAEGASHPTAGGLRIGKPNPERTPEEAYDPRAEWDQDGQYYHYLTKWMHALNAMANATEDARYRRWAAELAVAAHRGFRSSLGPPRLYWKMSIDLSRPLVPSSGLHDPLDGLVTGLALRARSPEPVDETLSAVIDDLADLCRGTRWPTDDPLGIGGLLFDAGRIVQLPAALAPRPGLLERVLEAASAGLAAFAESDALRAPASHRLAFRELGLAIGMGAIDVIYQQHPTAPVLVLLDRLQAQRRLGSIIETFWLEPAHRQNPTWTEHGDINSVMLATRLLPEAFLAI